METKKTLRADLESKSALFFSMGLLIAMTLVVSAFKWRDYDQHLVDFERVFPAFENPPEVPPTDQTPPPPPPPIPTPRIVEVSDDEKVKDLINVINVEADPETPLETFVIKEGPKEEPDEIFPFVEEPAIPKDGWAAFYKYVGDHLKYPAQARRMTIEGKVFVEFVINKDGSITDVKAVKGIGAGCDEEAVRVLQIAPVWSPGKQRGKPVRQRMVLPIIFKLQ